ncbi:hypothetical protein ACLB2K_025663 [Fragaria x ananassa]
MADRTWNHSLLSASFDPVDIEIIQAIPLSNRSIPNRLVWHYDVKGRFSMKSAYVLARQLNQSQPSALVRESVQKFWKKVCFPKAPGKVKVHIWKVCSSILPIVSALRTKRQEGVCGEWRGVSEGGAYVFTDMVEAVAGRVACELALEFQLSPIVFESDCLKLVKASKESAIDGSEKLIWLLKSQPSWLYSLV